MPLGAFGRIGPSLGREFTSHRGQARASAAIPKDDRREPLNWEAGKTVYLAPVIWFLILTEGAALGFLTLIVFW